MLGASLAAHQILKVFEVGKLRKGVCPNLNQELLGSTVHHGTSDYLLVSLSDYESSIQQCLYCGSRMLDATYLRNLGYCDRLLVRNDRKRLERGYGKPS